MPNSSRRRALFNGPASTGSNPSMPTSSITTCFFPGSSPATSMSGFTGYSAALAILLAPVVLRVLKMKAPGAQLGDLLAGGGVEAEDELQTVGTHAQRIGAVDHDLARKAAQAFHGRLGRGPGRRDHHDLSLFDGFGRRFEALLGQRRIFRIGGIA